ncbi:hypothetical protein LCGC14_0223150 [marine sediment metagenome]|uniref:Uncharacterized protein n=1 Tax=marine sediment metagenome TaxID=412755 RepID=A0A0F9UT94_9ZZZZ|nr:hypothetical protein [bacterium]
MAKKKVVSRNKPSLFPKKISAKINEEHQKWYQNQAGYRKMTLSEFIRAIPNIFFKLNSALDDKDNVILDLKERLNVGL